MNVFVTASNAPYKTARHINTLCAKVFGKFDKIISYDIDIDIDDVFREKNKLILSEKKGAGLWLWKVYFINKALQEECNEGDVLFYLDAAAFFYKKVDPIIERMDDDIFATQVPYFEESFTKREVLIALGMDKKEYRLSRQFQASFLAIRKTERGLDFINYWYNSAQQFDLIGPEWDDSIQYSTFKDHRYDQSLFSLTCKRYNVDPHDDPTRQGMVGYPYVEGASYKGIKRKNEYTPCIFLHRTKGNLLNIWMRMIDRDTKRNKKIKSQIVSGIITY